MAEDWKKKQGKKNRAKGGEFEREVRADLVADGYIVDKFNNNIDLWIEGEVVMGGEFIQSKPYFLRGRGMMMGAGFPDFIAFKKSLKGEGHEIILVECKLNGKLEKLEKQKMGWLESEGFECWVASKDEFGDVLYEKRKLTSAEKKVKKGGIKCRFCKEIIKDDEKTCNQLNEICGKCETKRKAGELE